MAQNTSHAVMAQRVEQSDSLDDFLCGTCGGGNVSRDAWADWDLGKQEWVLGTVFDYGHCHDCDGESSLEEVEVADAATE